MTAVEYSASGNLIIGATEKGMLIAWHSDTLRMKATHDFRLPISAMSLCSNKPVGFVAVGNTLYWMAADIEAASDSIFITTQELMSTHNDIITHCKVGHQSDNLAILVIHTQVNIDNPSETTSEYYLKMFAVVWQQDRPVAVELMHTVAVSARPISLDLTEDSCFVAVACNDGKAFWYDFEQGSEMDEAAEHAMKWSGDGLITSSTMKPVVALWEEKNKVTKIVKLDNETVCVGDERGTLTLVSLYPSGDVRSIDGIYSSHLSNINIMTLSHDRRHLLTYSTSDRAIFKWKILKQSSSNGQRMVKSQGKGNKSLTHLDPI